MTVGTRTALRTAMRAAAVQLFKDFAATRPGPNLQIYRARPASIYAPSAFLDAFREQVDHVGLTGLRRRPVLPLVVLHAKFDSGDAVDQADEFVDAFVGFVADRFHAAGANTEIGLGDIEDDPSYTPDWLPADKTQSFYATVISLEGLAQD